MRIAIKAKSFRRFLTEHNLSQNEFAHMAGTDSGYLSQLLSGQRFPSPKMRARLLTVLNHLQKKVRADHLSFSELYFKVR